MTPLEKALQHEGEINYCDECELMRIVDRAAYCSVSGKIIHPMMFDRSVQGYGPAHQCKQRRENVGMRKDSIEKLDHVRAIFFTLDFGGKEEGYVALYDGRTVEEQQVREFIKNGGYSPNVIVITAELAENVLGIKTKEKNGV